MSIAKTDGTAGTCTECWCLVEQGMERAHEEWHQKQDQALRGLDENDRTVLGLVEILRDRISRLRHRLLEFEGRAP